ncbi:MAG TPA: hypothetical protein RMH99_06215, partial [Sandaracinaceae bacterium LLY-WYZ-13_1]|nr:hypothetical protein [Sandaracinaceae bacterium LLY-WYZ-13_1]
ALVFGGLLLVLHWVQLLVLPRMWVEGGWREVIGEGARAGVMAATAYYGMEPIIRKRWPGLLVGWGRLVRWRGRDPVLGREVLLGLAALLPFALVLAVARVHLGAGEALVRVPVVAFAGRPLAWASGFGGIAVAGAALVIAGLFASAIAHHVVRVPWVALTVGMGLSAWGLGAICAWGSWLVVAANLLVLVALAYRGGLIALVTFQHGAIGLAGILPISAGPALLPFTLVGFAFYVALVALGLWLGAPRKALTTSRRSPHPPGGPAEPSPEPCASAEPETDAARTRPARRRRAPKTETLTED